MIRDTLEMVPVALVLAVVLSFGIRSGSSPAFSSSGRFMAIPAPAYQDPPPSADRGTGIFSTPRATAQQALPGGGNPGGDTQDGDLQDSMVSAVAPARPTLTFLPRRTHQDGVPYYTAADLAPLPVREPSLSPGQSVHAEGALTFSVTTTRSAEQGAIGTPDTAARESVPGTKFNLNRAQVEDLVRVPGIGRSRAQMIITQKPPGGYSSWDQVDALPGFGPGTLGMLIQHAELD